MLGRLTHIRIDQHDLGAGLGHGDRHVGAGGGFPGSRLGAGADNRLFLGGGEGEQKTGADVLIGLHNLKGAVFRDVGVLAAGDLRFFKHACRLPSGWDQSWESRPGRAHRASA